MAAIRTLNFLPEIFQTPSNSQFLEATLDQLVNPPVTKKIQGYIGSKFGYGINANDYYVTEPTKERKDYQLEPGVVFTKTNESIAKDFISYPGLLDALKMYGGVTNNNNSLFNSQFYSWDSFTDLDKLINFNQYYWLPDGPPAVTVASATVFSKQTFIVRSLPNGYSISVAGQTGGSINPTLTLLRGGTYTFRVDQTSDFWIQSEQSVTGFSPVQPNLNVREVFGVDPNGVALGEVIFQVPSKNAQDIYNYPGNVRVDLVSNKRYSDVSGKLLSEILADGGIDGVTSLEGLTVLFFNGLTNEEANLGAYDLQQYDQTQIGLDIPFDSNESITNTSQNFYKVYYYPNEDNPSDPFVILQPNGEIPIDTKITSNLGIDFINFSFYKNATGPVRKIPLITAPLDILYYQDGTDSNKTGVIRLIESNITNTLNVETDIIGKKTFTSTNGIEFTNGLKVRFDGDILPTNYLSGEYYVQGVGTAIELVPVDTLIAPEAFTTSTSVPYDSTNYDIGSYDADLYLPDFKDYITIARNSINKNAWSRSNRWFHIDVINATAQYNNNPNIVAIYGRKENKAQRPIIEFYPNLKLFNSGTEGKDPIDFIDFRNTDAFSQVEGQQQYYPDVEVYSEYTGTLASVTGATSTTFTIGANQITGALQVDQFIQTSTNALPERAYITSITGTVTLTITIEWDNPANVVGGSNIGLVASDTDLANYALFPGARIIFASDENESIKTKIYVVEYNTLTVGGNSVITLTEAPDADVLIDNQVVVFRGYYNQGNSFWFDGVDYKLAQQKTTINQPPLFDVYDKDGISFADATIYQGTSFKGCKLFSYAIGEGTEDSVLGFPLTYSQNDNVGDIAFDISLNSDTFNYVKSTTPVTQKVNTGYVYNYADRVIYNRELGWQTAVAESVQYQLFSFDYDPNTENLVFPTNTLTTYTVKCDIAPMAQSETEWPVLQVYDNNVYLNYTTNSTPSFNEYTIVSTTDNSITIKVGLFVDVKTQIQVLLLSNQVSENAYFTIPVNLNNNPFNENIELVNVGDIRGHYQSIFRNCPNSEGEIFGANNYRDLGNVVPYGNRIIQNSASLVLPAAFLRQQNYNLFDALLYNSREYIKYKTLLVDIVNNTDYSQRFDASYMLDNAVEQISSYKDEVQPFFWSDMIPNKSVKISNTYSFANNLDTSIFPLSQVYNFDTANYNGVLIYLNRTVNGINITKQLIKDVDYIVSETQPSVTVTLDLVLGDKIIVKEYDKTYGSYVPNTPTKLGLYPATIPNVVLDDTYNEPTYFIVGHDGSYNKLYGEYDPVYGILFDFRDQVLLEFETRIYNNLKLGAVVPFRDYEILPNYYNQDSSGYSYDQWLEMYSYGFLDWVGQNRLDYKRQLYNVNNQFTYNYRNAASDKIDNEIIKQGFWRGINQYYFNTTTPNLYPWQMLGYANQPTWWTDRYGPAPYTSGNLIMWQDIFDGYDWNNGNPKTIKQLKKSIAERNSDQWNIDFNNFMKILPVSVSGQLLSPINSTVGNYNPKTLRKDWAPGDMAPVELSYRRSSSWPFDLMRLFALTKPAKFFNLGADLDNYRYSEEFNQFLVNDRSHLVIDNIEIYGNGIAKTSYINWIVDYEKQLGAGATEKIKDLLFNLDVRLVFRLAGFSDKTLLKFYVEKGTPNSRDASLLIPDESYSLLLYDNQASDKLMYSSVIVQTVPNGYAVYGNSQLNAYFKVLKPVFNGTLETLTVDNVSVKVTEQFSAVEEIVPYGAVFYSAQELSQFLLSYGAWLTSRGAEFDIVQNGVTLNWDSMVLEFLYWTQLGFEVGSIMTLNPAASLLKVNKESLVVQPLTIQKDNFVLNQNLYPIALKDLSIFRKNTEFTVKALNEGDTIAYGQFNLSNFEHGIVFDNVTLFDDVIYDLQTGLRQNRITLRGTKTADWNGTIFASGFIINQDNIQEWNKGVVYTKGSIVKFKNKYWTALKIVQPANEFQEKDWKETEYNEIQKGLLPNSSTRSYESALYYNVDEANLERDADLLSYSLIGYRPRDYLALADLTDITQINVYKNMIKNKGTRNSVNAFKGANLPQGGIDYEVYENWAIKQGEYGGVLNNNFVEFKLSQPLLTSNPFTVALTNGVYTPGVQQEVPIYSLYNYSRPVTNPNILPTVSEYTPSTVFPDAGYANVNDVKMMSYFMPSLAAAVDKSGLVIPLSRLYVRDYVWIANDLSKWQIYTPVSIGQVISASYNVDATSTITFAQPHGLKQFDVFAIVGFNTQVDGYYTVDAVLGTNQVVVTLTFQSNTRIINGLGVALKFSSQRVDTPADINTLPLLDAEFTKNTVWVDQNADGGWAVYRKSINYQYDQVFTKPSSLTFGSAVAYDSEAGYLISDKGLGEVYRYRFNPLYNELLIDETLTGNVSFGSTIVHEQNLYAISQPENSPSVQIYVINDSQFSDNISLLQTITNPTDDENFGVGLALSGDTNWLYVSNFNENTISAKNNVHVYRKQNIATDAGSFVEDETYIITSIGDEVTASQIVVGQTYQILFTGNTDFTLIGAADNVIGTTFVATGTTSGSGICYHNPTDFMSLGAVENKVGIYFVANGLGSGTGTANLSSYEYIDTISSGEISIDKFGYTISTNYYGDTVVIGAPRRDYSATIANYGKAYVYSRSVQNYEAPNNSPVIFELAWTPTVGQPLFVTRNGLLVDPTNYAVTGSTFTYTGTCLTGDIINVSGNQFTLVQTLETTETPRTGVQFGTSVDNNTFATEILVGAPFALNSTNQEGAVYRYTNGGSNYGTVVGTNECNVTTNKILLINGYAVTVNGNAASVASQINNAQITNITASASNNTLVISVISLDLALVNQKLVLTAIDPTLFAELGIEIYTQTQVINCPHETGPTQFGTVVKFNESNSVVISAPVGQRYAQTTFDFIDDENLDNDTVFDNNATQFVDNWKNAGAVYMFDYLGVYNENVNNPGQFVYAQSTNATDQTYGAQPRYGTAIDFNQNQVIIGTPGFKPETVDGQVVVYINESGLRDWSVYRQSSPIVDVNKIENIQLFSAETNNTLINLDYFDPLQGKLLGAIRENIDVISNTDPASYNLGDLNNTSIAWGAAQEGSVWFDTTNVRYLNYHQDDPIYNAEYWGRLFPGSNVAVYTWVASNVVPSAYAGPGTPYDLAKFSVQTIIDSTNNIAPVYYFWVRNTGVVYKNKQLADITIASYIANPLGTGISYMTPLLPNAVAVYNSQQYVNANDTVIHIGYSNNNNDVSHSEYTLVRANYPEDFLPGVPDPRTNKEPEGLYDRLLDSLAGVDETGQVVPNPYLPKAVQSGVLARPRQSFFYNRFVALENYLTYANNILSQYPITEIKITPFLFKSGEYYNVQDYWEYTNYWVAPYNNNTKSAFVVPLYADLLELSPALGTIATVAQNGQGLQETYIYEYNEITKRNNWVRIGLQNGTIRFKTQLWDYNQARLGFGDNFFDTDSFDIYPSEETRWIVRSLNEEIYTEELLIHRNKSLILLFDYIQSETIDNQNYLPWLNKTSLADVNHKIRELLPYEVFQNDNQEFLAGYLNEVKPYHVVIKDFLFTYEGSETYEGDVTDFDLPAEFATNLNQFLTPQLVFERPSGNDQFLPNNSIWQNPEYTQWYANKGVSLTGVNDYQISKLGNYLTLGFNEFIAVENASGFPINGVITIGSEDISYTRVDRVNNLLLGITRGFNETAATTHIPGEDIFIDLPAVVLLNGGTQYDPGLPPKVNVVYDTALYGEPAIPAELEVTMGNDTITSITVINPGQGYIVTPKIEIDPSLIITFSSENVNTATNTITIFAPLLADGNEVRYIEGTSSIGGLTNGEWYYVNVLQTNPTTVIALYTDLSDAINDTNRVRLYNKGTGTSHSLNLGARAYPIVTSMPVRENITTLRYDRTSYRSQVTDWESGKFYAASFNGECLTDTLSSSSLQLQATQPSINSILAAADGFVLQIDDVNNDEVTIWSQFERRISRTVDVNNVIRLNPYNSTEPNASGSTIGMTLGMPIKFIGDPGTSNIIANTVYYVKEIVNDIDFTISESVNGPTFVLNEYIFSAGDLVANTAKIINTAILTVTYPGIRTVTQTESGTNLLTIPLSPIGTGGTEGMYVNMPVEFVGNVFGGIENNGVYYVTTVADNQHFTISTKTDPLQFTITSIITDSKVRMDSTIGLSVNDPIIFNTYVISALSISDGLLCTIVEPGNTDFTLIGAPNNFKGTTFVANGAGTGTGKVTSNSFGGIISGKVYYVATIDAQDSITISETVGGPQVTLTVVNFGGLDGSSALMTSQVDTLDLTSSTGDMTVNLCMPISQGQINKQQFTFYTTGGQYANILGTISNLVSGTVKGIVAGGWNRLELSAVGNELDSMYVNMPLQFNTAIAGDFAAFTTYYIADIGETEFVVTRTFAGSNILETDDTSILYVGMPITFSVLGLGGVKINTVYYVNEIVDLGQFKISVVPGGLNYQLTNSIGNMVATGTKYITLSATVGGSELPVTTTNAVNVAFTQQIEQTPKFDVSWVLGGYNVLIDDNQPGLGFASKNVITITGSNFSDVGGTAPTNNITITVDSIDDTGQITNIIVEGNPPDVVNKYYLEVLTANTVAVFSDPLCTQPVSGIDFPYVGYTLTDALSVTYNTIALSDASQFNVNDPIVFTGDLGGNVYLESGKIYYIKTKVGNDITLTLEPGNSVEFAVVIPPVIGVAWAIGTVTVAKAGAFAFLQQPFYFSPSIVKWNNQVWMCIVSNHDDGDSPTLGKWVILSSGDRQLNAMDRVKGYYQPTINMPGTDLSQLFEGVEYPNTTYLGKQFSPVPNYAIDTILQDQPFYPTNINTVAIEYDGSNYIAPANLPEYSAFLLDGEANYWDIAKIANVPLGLTDIVYGGGYYVMTSTNSATPILRSNNGTTWTTNGYFTPYGDDPFDSLNYDMTSLSVSAISLSSVAYATIDSIPTWVAVGKNIVTSYDTYIWNESYVFDSVLTNYNLYTVSYVNVPSFAGFIAAGIADGQTVIVKSVDGIVWTDVSITDTKSIYGISTNGTVIVAVGEDGIIYTSTNATTWTLASYTAPRTLNDVTFANSIFMAVGDDGLCITSSDGITWSVETTGTLKKLNSLNYVTNDEGNYWTIVGNDNTIIQSDDNGTSWNTQNVFNVAEPIYTIQGDPFLAGYGPEELVPGVISDSFAMVVKTRPGTLWPATQYGHVGFNIVSDIYTPSSANDKVFKFAGSVQNPAQIRLTQINKSTGLGTTLYEGINYTIDWKLGFVTLLGTNPLNFVTVNNTDTLQIDVYEVGNGNQLVKSDTLSDPMLINSTTGFTEIFLDCNYTAPLWEGSGVIKPNTFPVETFAVESIALTDSIKVTDITMFTVNDQIYFSGSIFGGVSENTPYYVKTISLADSSITISNSISGGVAGPTFPLISDAGSMIVEIENGSASVWTNPIIYVNGIKQTLGNTVTVSRTKAINNAIVCNSTAGFYANAKVTFSENMFGLDILPLTTYYISSVIDNTQFTISETIGGPEVVLTNATGAATLITEDFAIGLADNSIKAKLIFANEYTESDFISYTLFGETNIIQYGYSIPEIQLMNGDGSNASFTLTNFVGLSNPNNAIVEIDGTRIDPTLYTIDFNAETIVFDSAPTANSTIAVTTFNDTQQQYFNTQTFNGINVSNIISIDNVISMPLANETVNAWSSTGNVITASDTSNFAVGQTVEFKGSASTNIQTDGTVYFVSNIINSTDFTICETPSDVGNISAEFDPGTGTGVLLVIVGGTPAVRVQTGIPHNFTSPTNNNIKVRLAGIIGSTQLNNTSYYVHVISDTIFDLYEQPYNSTVGGTNQPITNVSSYVSGGYAWDNQSFVISDADVTDTLLLNEIKCVSVDNLIVNTPVYFTENGVNLGEATTIPEIIAGQKYYIKEVNLTLKTFTITESYEGEVKVITSGISAGNVKVSQWEQTNVDRLYVTINGERVPNDLLQLSDGNQLNILSVINSLDNVIITSMIPTATPNENVYINFVNQDNQGSVYRVNELSTTFLTKSLGELDAVIYVNDASRLSNTIIQEVVAPTPNLNKYSIGLTVDKASIQSVTVFNNTKGELIDKSDYDVEIEALAPILKITAGIWISPGDSLTITTIEGKLIYINGEQIIVGSVNLANNTLGDLTRGANGTGVQTFIPKYSEVYGLLPKNSMNPVDYTKTWNPVPGIYNTTEGDPLQISETVAANFLKVD